MAHICTAEEERLLADSTTTVFLGLFDETKSEVELEAGTATGEITGYTGDRKAITWGSISQVGGKATIANSAAIEFEDMPVQGASNKVAYFGVFTAATAGVMRWWVPMGTAKTTNAGDTFRVPIGDLVLDLA